MGQKRVPLPKLFSVSTYPKLLAELGIAEDSELDGGGDAGMLCKLEHFAILFGVYNLVYRFIFYFMKRC